ncbi:MAG: hypothetical protein ABIC04_00895 [Nanoarchaeota archaeon]
MKNIVIFILWASVVMAGALFINGIINLFLRRLNRSIHCNRDIGRYDKNMLHIDTKFVFCDKVGFLYYALQETIIG